jgi:hypothetical protein
MKKSFVEEKRNLSSMFLESSPSESFIKSSSLSELELQSFVEEKPSLSELSPHFKASLSPHQVFLSEENHQSLSLKKPSLSLKKPSLSV